MPAPAIEPAPVPAPAPTPVPDNTPVSNTDFNPMPLVAGGAFGIALAIALAEPTPVGEVVVGVGYGLYQGVGLIANSVNYVASYLSRTPGIA